MPNSDNNDDELVPRQDDSGEPVSDKKKFNPTKAQKYMIAAGTLIIIAVSVILYVLPEKKKPVVHRNQIRKQEIHKSEGQKVMTSSHQSVVKASPPEHDTRFTNSTAAKAVHSPGQPGEVNRENKPAATERAEATSPAKPSSLKSMARLKKRRVLSEQMMNKLNPRHAVKGTKPEAVLLPMANAIPQKPVVVETTAPVKHVPRDRGAELTAENKKLFMAKGWATYYASDNDILLYRKVDEGSTDTTKMINSAWFLGGDNIVLFANAVNCPEQSMDTFAYTELDAQTLKIVKGRSRDVTDEGMQYRYITDASDLALYDKVCK
jgi:hypothetical protein